MNISQVVCMGGVGVLDFATAKFGLSLDVETRQPLTTAVAAAASDRRACLSSSTMVHFTGLTIPMDGRKNVF
jgi:hypothetical protein